MGYRHKFVLCLQGQQQQLKPTPLKHDVGL